MSTNPRSEARLSTQTLISTVLLICAGLIGMHTIPLASHEVPFKPTFMKVGYFVPEGWSVQTYAKRMYRVQGGSERQWLCLKQLWTRESHWNYKSRNKHGGALGIAQAYPATKMAISGNDYKTNPATQVVWGLRYIKSHWNNNACLALHHNITRGYY